MILEDSIVTYAIKHQEINQFIHTKHIKNPPIMQLLLLKLLQKVVQLKPNVDEANIVALLLLMLVGY